MNNKGMTTVELIASFSLATIIFIILFNLTISLKNIYMDSGIKTNYLIEQANLSSALNSSINSQSTINSVELNTNNDKYTEYSLTIDNEIKPLVIDQNNRKITYDKYTYNYDNKTKIKIDTTKYVTCNNIGPFIHMSNNLLIIDIPIYVNNYNENLGVKVLYQINDNEIQVIE